MSLFEKVFTGVDEMMEHFNTQKGTQKLYNSYLKQCEGTFDFAPSMLQKAEECSNFIELHTDATRTHYKIVRANYCHQRFCPTCVKITSRKQAFELATAVEHLKKAGKRFLFMTLTVPNCKGDELKRTVKGIYKSYERMMKWKRMSFVLGAYKKLEVTYNKDRDDYHPHLHVLLCVDNSYFNDKDKYLETSELAKLWLKACLKAGLEIEAPLLQVDLRKTQDSMKDILELAKYMAKPSDYLSSLDVFKVYYDALSNVRFYSYSGVLKVVIHKVKIGAIEMVGTEEEIEYTMVIRLYYNGFEYVLTSSEELMKQETQKAPPVYMVQRPNLSEMIEADGGYDKAAFFAMLKQEHDDDKQRKLAELGR